ncbi:hypothetical protein E4T56_gene7540, partial [Termitomyces sp. T112]
HQAERIDGAEVRAVLQHGLGRRIDFQIGCIGAGFIERNPGRHRTGERREIKIHPGPPWAIQGQGLIGGMVQKERPPAGAGQPRRRGRPRAYEPDIALGKALDLFRTQGFAATSLDDLSEATGMNRPSLYGAFGDKRELYIKSYQRYREEARAAMVEIFAKEMPLRQRLERIFASALNIYLSGENGPRGCFTVVTAASEAVGDPEIRAMVLDGL